jgi:hypothetical protein
MTNFAYNDGVPATNNNPSVDQPDMLINTQSIKNLINVDHLSFGVDDGGTHKQTTLNRLAVKPSLVGTQVALYSKLATNPASSQLFFEDSAGNEFQLTGNTAAAATGYVLIGGSVLFKWGTVSVNPSSTANFNFDTTIPYTTVYSVTTGVVNNTNGLNDHPYIKSISTTTVVVSNPSGQTWSVKILAVGTP